MSAGHLAVPTARSTSPGMLFPASSILLRVLLLGRQSARARPPRRPMLFQRRSGREPAITHRSPGVPPQPTAARPTAHPAAAGWHSSSGPAPGPQHQAARSGCCGGPVAARWCWRPVHHRRTRRRRPRHPDSSTPGRGCRKAAHEQVRAGRPHGLGRPLSGSLPLNGLVLPEKPA